MQPEGRPPRPEAESRGGRQGYATRGSAAQARGRIKGRVAGVCNQRGGRPGLVKDDMIFIPRSKGTDDSSIRAERNG